MNKPNGYDEAQSYGEFEQIELGGHVLQIQKVEEFATQTGKHYIKVTFDTAPQDKQPMFYTKQFGSDTRENKKYNGWTNIFVEGYEGGTSKQFKEFCTSVEESNSIEMQWGPKFCDAFRGKYVGGVFREEDYLGSDGKEHTARKIAWFQGTADVLNAPIPKKRERKQENATTYEAAPPDGFDYDFGNPPF